MESKTGDNVEPVEFTLIELEHIERALMAHSRELDSWKEHIEMADRANVDDLGEMVRDMMNDEDEEGEQETDSIAESLLGALKSLQNKALENAKEGLAEREKVVNVWKGIYDKANQPFILSLKSLESDIKSAGNMPNVPTRTKTAMSLLQVAKLLASDNDLFTDSEILEIGNNMSKVMEKVFK